MASPKVSSTKHDAKLVEKKDMTEAQVAKPEETKQEKPIEKKEETKTDTKKTEKKKTEQKEKTKATAKGVSLRISPKYAIAICKMIKGKTPEQAVNMLTEVTQKKRPVPMAALEVAHQKGKGIAGAKYPKNAALAIKTVAQQVGANAIVNGIENPVITIAKADRATAPMKTGGRQAKRAHVLLEVRDKSRLKIKTKEKKK